jgi:hypothetical protein
VLFANDPHQHVLSAPAVESTAKDLLPGAKDFDELSRVVQLPIGDCYDDLEAHHLAFQVGIAVVPFDVRPVARRRRALAP